MVVRPLWWCWAVLVNLECSMCPKGVPGGQVASEATIDNPVQMVGVHPGVITEVARLDALVLETTERSLRGVISQPTQQDSLHIEQSGRIVRR